MTNNGKKGGVLKGKPHFDENGKAVGGIKAIVTDMNNEPVELEGGEVIINKKAAAKNWKQLSKINQSAGDGVPITDPTKNTTIMKNGGVAGSLTLILNNGQVVTIGDRVQTTGKSPMQIEITNITDKWVIFNDLNENNKRKDSPLEAFKKKSVTFITKPKVDQPSNNSPSNSSRTIQKTKRKPQGSGISKIIPLSVEMLRGTKISAKDLTIDEFYQIQQSLLDRGVVWSEFLKMPDPKKVSSILPSYLFISKNLELDYTSSLNEFNVSDFKEIPVSYFLNPSTHLSVSANPKLDIDSLIGTKIRSRDISESDFKKLQSQILGLGISWNDSNDFKDKSAVQDIQPAYLFITKYLELDYAYTDEAFEKSTYKEIPISTFLTINPIDFDALFVQSRQNRNAEVELIPVDQIIDEASNAKHSWINEKSEIDKYNRARVQLSFFTGEWVKVAIPPVKEMAQEFRDILEDAIEKLSPIIYDDKIKHSEQLSNLSNEIAEFESFLNILPSTSLDSLAETSKLISAKTKELMEEIYFDCSSYFDIYFFSCATPNKRMVELTSFYKSVEFQNWFLGSKVVTPEHSPRVVFHGTPANNFHTFNFELFPGVYFAEEQSYSDWFAARGETPTSGTLYECFLNVKNPIDLRLFKTDTVTYAEFTGYIKLKYGYILPENQMLKDRSEAMGGMWAWMYLRNSPEWLKYIRDNGIFDGITYYENNPQDIIGGKENVTAAWMVFFPNQIKNAFGNLVYSANSNDIRFKKGGVV